MGRINQFDRIGYLGLDNINLEFIENLNEKGNL